ncbi:hypothetical protein AAVH_23377, partial [Aphelenchoides avenae]
MSQVRACPQLFRWRPTKTTRICSIAGDFKDEAKKAIVGVEEPEPERRKVS